MAGNWVIWLNYSRCFQHQFTKWERLSRSQVKQNIKLARGIEALKRKGGGTGTMYAPVPDMNTPVGNHSTKKFQRMATSNKDIVVSSRIFQAYMQARMCSVVKWVLRTWLSSCTFEHGFCKNFQMCFGWIIHEWRHFRDSQPVVLYKSSSHIGSPHTNCNLHPVLSQPSLANKRNVAFINLWTTPIYLLLMWYSSSFARPAQIA